MLSLASHRTLENLLHPFHTFIGKMDTSVETLSGVRDYQIPSTHPLPCDIQLIDASPLPAYSDPLDDHSFYATSKFALLVRRVGFDGQFLGGTPLPECQSEESQLGQVRN